MPPFFILFVGFALAVTAVWLRHHVFALPEQWFVLSLPLTLFFGIGLISSIPWLYPRFRKAVPTLRVPRVASLVIVSALSFILFNFQAFGIGPLTGHDPLIPFTLWRSANLAFSLKLGCILTTYFFLTLVFAATGHRVLKRLSFQTPPPPSYTFFLQVIVGMSLWATLLVTLGALSVLTPVALWISAIGIMLVEWRYVWSLIRWCSATDHWPIDVRQPMYWITFLGLFLIVLNLTETLRPEPTGFDDMTYYMDHAHQMQLGHVLLPGGNPFPFELSAASLGIATEDQTMFFALSLGVYGLLLATALLFAFGRAIGGVSVGTVAAIIALSVPMSPALALLETKPDAWLFPVTILFFWSLIRWLQSQEIELFFISLFLFGFAMTLKLTALFLIGPLSLAIGIAFFAARHSLPLSPRALILTVIFLLLPLAPWIWLAAATHPENIPWRTDNLLTSYPSTPPALTHHIEALLADAKCEPTGTQDDFTRFTAGRGPMADWFFLPWDITMNLTVAAFATEIGFLFLAILPLWLWLGARRLQRQGWRHCLRSTSVQLMFFFFGYGLLWVIFAERIPWYGYPAVTLASLLSALVINRSQSISPYLFRFLFILLAISLIGNTVVRLKFAGAPEHVRYAGGTLNALDFLETTFPGLKTIQSAINRPAAPKVYITGSRLRYALDDHTQRTYNDPHLDTFDCLLTTFGTEGVLEKFRELDIQYVFFSRTLLTKLTTQRSLALRGKVERFVDFAGHQLRVVWGSADYMLFELPPLSVPVTTESP